MEHARHSDLPARNRFGIDRRASPTARNMEQITINNLFDDLSDVALSAV